ncbi:hypothetical protein BGY98DRAFT_234109 [Russula aff. rugulosa BPL654]|nr:hypothetical protein BGY98DRAFT_234109 [Russula aff. rugulosa BPL654]
MSRTAGCKSIEDQDRSSYSDSRLMSCDETLRNRECYRTFRHLSDSAKRCLANSLTNPHVFLTSALDRYASDVFLEGSHLFHLSLWTFWMEFSRQDVIDHAVTIRASVLQRESFAMLHTVFDQASFKRLEGAKSDLQHEKKIIWLHTDGLYGIRGREKLWAENGLAQALVRPVVTCVLEYARICYVHYPSVTRPSMNAQSQARSQGPR